MKKYFIDIGKFGALTASKIGETKEMELGKTKVHQTGRQTHSILSFETPYTLAAGLCTSPLATLSLMEGKKLLVKKCITPILMYGWCDVKTVFYKSTRRYLG